MLGDDVRNGDRAGRKMMTSRTLRWLTRLGCLGNGSACAVPCESGRTRPAAVCGRRGCKWDSSSSSLPTHHLHLPHPDREVIAPVWRREFARSELSGADRVSALQTRIPECKNQPTYRDRQGYGENTQFIAAVTDGSIRSLGVESTCFEWRHRRRHRLQIYCGRNW
ncbi:uncharacterized protein LOC142560005 isoform X2 [Dermacentor variabilis]|uniref:uncharacterized protein LOC142560005 isoform X2 n=1 Tax=Dermacentor variabilis TaxID=34621 RepID=UPI003F5AEDCB